MGKLVCIMAIFLFIGLNAKETSVMTCLELITLQKNNERRLNRALEKREQLYEQKAENEEALEELNDLIDQYTIRNQELILEITNKKCLKKK